MYLCSIYTVQVTVLRVRCKGNVLSLCMCIILAVSCLPFTLGGCMGRAKGKEHSSTAQFPERDSLGGRVKVVWCRHAPASTTRSGKVMISV